MLIIFNVLSAFSLRTPLNSQHMNWWINTITIINTIRWDLPPVCGDVLLWERVGDIETPIIDLRALERLKQEENLYAGTGPYEQTWDHNNRHGTISTGMRPYEHTWDNMNRHGTISTGMGKSHACSYGPMPVHIVPCLFIWSACQYTNNKHYS